MSEPAATSTRPTQERIDIKFDGEGIVNGTINARALAVALQGTADLVQAIASLDEYKQHVAPELKVIASSEGSFELQLILETLGAWWEAVRPVLTGDDANAINTLATFAAVTTGVIGYLARKGKKRAKAVEPTDDGQVEVTLSDDSKIVAEQEVVTAAEDPRVQRAAKRVVSPTTFRGIENIHISAKTVNLTVVVNGEEAERFAEPDDAPPEVPAKTYEVWATFGRPDFGGDKWGVTSTRGTWEATISDPAFLASVDDGTVSINKYSEFRVEIREEPYVTPGGQTRFHRTVTKVWSQRDGAEARRALPDEAGEGEL